MIPRHEFAHFLEGGYLPFVISDKLNESMGTTGPKVLRGKENVM